MTQQEQRCRYLVEQLLAEYPPQNRPMPAEGWSRQEFLRALMNVRPPVPVSREFLQVQDQYLQEQRRQAGIVEASTLPTTAGDRRISLWQGDITRLRCDAIVNAANSALLGCFRPLHGCIDNAIHWAAGVQLRLYCQRLMERQGHEEPTEIGRAHV